MKVALVYDRINKWGGAERVLVALNKLFPEASWYTSVWNPSIATFSRGWNVRASWLNKVPFLRNHHEWIPFLMPYIFEGFDLSKYDLVISVSSEAAKGVITRPGTVHIDYCLTPTRYLYSHKKTYLTNPIYSFIASIVRRWDEVASTRPDEMIAISTSVKNRIKKYYNRDSAVIFPPVDTAKFNKPATCGLGVKDFYLVVSRLVPYKKIDTIIKAFNKMPDKSLVIVGTGSETARLRSIAKRNTRFVGEVDESDLFGYYAACRAFIQSNIEDFGLVMVEAQAAGKPVLARNGGGAVDIIQDGITGMLYDGKGVIALVDAIKKFEKQTYSSEKCKKNAQRFDIHIWEASFKERVKEIWQST